MKENGVSSRLFIKANLRSPDRLDKARALFFCFKDSLFCNRSVLYNMKNVGRILGKVCVWLVLLFAVAMMIFTVVSTLTFNRNDRSVFGYKLYIVKTDSMAATDFAAGSLIFVKEVG